MNGTEPGTEALPKSITKPARRALHGAGVLTMRDLERFSRAELMALHGFGPRALEVLGPELEKKGLRLRD